MPRSSIQVNYKFEVKFPFIDGEKGITYFKFSPQFFSDENSFACYYMLIIVTLSLNYSLLNYFFPLLLYNNTKEKKERKKKEI